MKKTLTVFAALACCALAPALAQAAGTKPVAKPAAKPAVPDEKAMQAAFEKMGAVGENHKLLDATVGDWDASVKMWMAPGAPPMESSGTMSSKITMGGRYIVGSYVGSFQGQPFEGTVTLGYDNLTGKFWNTWIDSGSTGVSLMTGSYDKATRAFTFRGSVPDPMAPATQVKVRQVVKITDDDHHTMEWHEARAGKEAKTMEITYTRKK